MLGEAEAEAEGDGYGYDYGDGDGDGNGDGCVRIVARLAHRDERGDYITIHGGTYYITIYSIVALFFETSEARMGVRKPSRSRKPRAKAWP